MGDDHYKNGTWGFMTPCGGDDKYRSTKIVTTVIMPAAVFNVHATVVVRTGIYKQQM